MIKLADKTDATVFVELPDDLLYDTEFKFSMVKQNTARTIGGQWVYQRGLKHKGEQIILKGSDNRSFITRDKLLELKQFYNNVNMVMVLTHPDFVVDVVFDYTGEGGTPITSSPLIPCSNPQPDALYSLTVNLRTV